MDGGWIYAAGIDPTQGGQSRTKLDDEGTSDDFAMSTWRARADGTGKAQLVHLVREVGMSSKQQSALIHRQHERFKYDILILDPSGGGLAVRDDLREPVQDDGTGRFDVVPLITIDDDLMAGQGDALVVFFGRGESRLQDLGSILMSESVLPNKAHETLRGAFFNHTVQLPPRSSLHGKFTRPDDFRRYLTKEAGGLGGREKVAAEIDLALFQLICVERALAPDGKTFVTDAKTGLFLFKSTEKKDSAYAVMYGRFGIWVLQEEYKKGEQKTRKRQTSYGEVDVIN